VFGDAAWLVLPGCNGAWAIDRELHFDPGEKLPGRSPCSAGTPTAGARSSGC
jgi:hypothetical protein